MFKIKLPRVLWLSVVSLFTSAGLCQAQDAPQPPANLKLFLLVGQSNMAGRGKVEPQDEVTNPQIWMLDKELKWVPAKDPVHFDKPAAAGVGLSMEFARTLLKSDPNQNIGLIPAAFGGTSLAQWAPRGSLYKDAISRTQEALKQGQLAGILWHQGESDSGSFNAPGREPYATRFPAFVAQLRKDLNAADVPFIFGELGRYRETFAPFNAMLHEVQPNIPNSALVSSEGLTHKGDNLHFSSESQRTFGQRYAEAYQALVTPGDATKTAP